jgi:glutamine synthetase
MGDVEAAAAEVPDVPDDIRDDADALQQRLEEAGVRVVAGFATNAAGLVHAKAMPVARTGAFVVSGAGMSPVYAGYAVDGSIRPSPHYDAVGDLRLRLVPDSVCVLDEGLALGATDVVTQAGEPEPASPRVVLQHLCSELARDGVEARVGHELELVLVAPDGSRLPRGAWTPYGLSALVDRRALLDDLVAAMGRAGIPALQLHAEYGAHQLEVSVPPAAPVEAADRVVVARAVVGQVARRHGLAASFSPVPFAGEVGNGAHQHASLRRDGRPLLAGGSGPHGLTDDGAAAIAGILARLEEVQGVLTGSALSGARLAPGMWSGASVGWGVENREASVRLVVGGRSNPGGSNLEVKPVDPSANPYLASAAVLALARAGLRERPALPPELASDPSRLSDAERASAGIRVLPRDHATVLDALDRSTLVRAALGDAVVDTLLAVRRHEADVFGPLDVEVAAERLRLTWSI